jgi:hypothetical protein
MHWWDWTTPIEEVMQGLNNLVKAGKSMCYYLERVLQADPIQFCTWVYLTLPHGLSPRQTNTPETTD